MKKTIFPRSRVVFFFDVDNTLLDNDDVIHDLRRHIGREFGHEAARDYWRIFENLRYEIGYADYLGALQRFRAEHPHEPRLLTISRFLLDYPFADRVYPKAFEAIEHVKSTGPAVILSDGDVVFQPHKVERSGISRAVADRVLIYVHKEMELDDVELRHPAGHYVLLDDKLRILSAVKAIWGSRVTTIFVGQGHYAEDREILAKYPAADIRIETIGELLEFDPAELRNGQEV
jgi:phosphoglycolate phosphatase-like HAD superfamily hydrolase